MDLSVSTLPAILPTSHVKRTRHGASTYSYPVGCFTLQKYARRHWNDGYAGIFCDKWLEGRSPCPMWTVRAYADIVHEQICVRSLRVFWDNTRAIRLSGHRHSANIKMLLIMVAIMTLCIQAEQQYQQFWRKKWRLLMVYALYVQWGYSQMICWGREKYSRVD